LRAYKLEPVWWRIGCHTAFGVGLGVGFAVVVVVVVVTFVPSLLVVTFVVLADFDLFLRVPASSGDPNAIKDMSAVMEIILLPIFGVGTVAKVQRRLKH
jgi:hypothetical protein